MTEKHANVLHTPYFQYFNLSARLESGLIVSFQVSRVGPQLLLPSFTNHAIDIPGVVWDLVHQMQLQYR